MERTLEMPVLKADRRHDLDALRAFAMLLGIGYHAALSFGGTPWLVTDGASFSTAFLVKNAASPDVAALVPR